jgi:hypothetical protein
MEKVPIKKIFSVNFSHILFFISLPLKMGPKGCPKMLVRNYHSTLCNISKECTSQDDLLMQALVWLCMVWFGAIWFSTSS